MVMTTSHVVGLECALKMPTINSWGLISDMLRVRMSVPHPEFKWTPCRHIMRVVRMLNFLVAPCRLDALNAVPIMMMNEFLL